MQPLPQAIKELYPFEPHYVTVGGWRMHYVDHGQGPPVVMLHGNPTWSFYYRDLIKGLSDRFRVVAPDHIGCGLSDKPQRYAYTLATHIENLKRLLDHLQLDNITLVVHDWGGAVGFGYAVRHPQRVRRLIVFNSAAFFGRVPLRIRLCRVPVFGTLAVRGLNAFARLATSLACKNRSRMTADVKAGYLWPYPDFASRIAIHRFVQDIPTRPSHPTYRLIQDIEAALPQFRDRPMLICWGMGDFCFTEAFLKKWVERFPLAQVHCLPAAGHYVVEDAAAQILPQVRDFLL
ncbi:MAG: alpha/beta fold hydrolase [Phycisphaerae bacterium]|nr:alpha/beta fold hydrolase [Phycisphaerae bacterium]